MTEWAAGLLERSLGVSQDRATNTLHIVGAVGAALTFVLLATFIVANDTLLSGQQVSNLHVGSIAPRNILAPRAITFESDVLTERLRQEAAASVGLVYDPPDPNVSRTQSQLAQQILDFILNVRRDPFATTEQKIADINQITALTLTTDQVTQLLAMSTEAWQAIDDEMVNVLERVMRESIRESDLNIVRNQLPTQVSIRFSTQESELIVALVEDLIRPNTFPNQAATEDARQKAVDAVAPVPRTFAPNEIVVRENEPITEADLEALQQLGLLSSDDRRLQNFAQALLASIVVVVITGLYIARFERRLYENSRFIMLLATIFLIVLAGARLVGSTGQIYLYPTAALALLYVSISTSRIALIGTMNLAFMAGLMMGNSLEVAVLVGAGGMIGMLTLRSTERLNNYFVAGLIVGLVNTIVATVFNLATPSSVALPGTGLSVLVLFSMINGIFAAAAAIIGMYVLTLIFNLPTSLKLAELSQPNHPLLQRLLREAPGTYQHSLQVGNLSEQAALAINANAELVRVAALYHDIGKMLNAAFFSENQQFGGGNPHDVLDDPYRSADIIVSHVTDGEDMAREYRLPNRLRDFIREHHGTTEVYVFYRKAVNAAGGDESAVDINEFRYPGPRPQTRETAIMMLADSCESAVRSIGPTSKQQVSEIVHDIVDGKIRTGQLDDSGLTLNDIKAIQRIFVEMLQAVYHPRIDYKKATAEASMPTQERSAATPRVRPATQTTTTAKVDSGGTSVDKPARRTDTTPMKRVETVSRVTSENDLDLLDDDDTPVQDVPSLPRSGEMKLPKSRSNGTEQRSEQKEPSE
ncbi:MAG: HDIG domain-containing protein [Anaerolineae bacterium]|nr:HDIG domain-containing protein [Anaerolineae bacterium]